MTLFQESTNQAAFLKAGVFGTTGAGKTFTAALIAIGLHKYIASRKPIYFIDTETGSDFVKPLFDKAGIKLFTLKTQAFSRLCEGIREAEGKTDIFMIDSITHPWRELMRAWKEKRNRVFISLRDFGPLKDEWHVGYTTEFVNSRMHCLMVGRAADIFSDVIDEEATEEKGREVTKSIKVGSKMSAEKETGFEPSLLIEMEKVFIEGTGKYVRRARIIKDRFNVIDSKEFDNPKFSDFLPHIKLLNLGGEHVGVDDASSVGMLQSPDTSYTEKQRWQKIYGEEIEGELRSFFPSQTVEDKKIRGDLLAVVFETRSWTQVTELPPEVLQKGLKAIKYLGRLIQDSRSSGIDGAEAVFTGGVPWLRGELIKMEDEMAEAETGIRVKVKEQ